MVAGRTQSGSGIDHCQFIVVTTTTKRTTRAQLLAAAAPETAALGLSPL